MAGIDKNSGAAIAALMRQSQMKRANVLRPLQETTATRWHYARAAAVRALQPPKYAEIAMQQTMAQVKTPEEWRAEVDLHRVYLPKIEVPQEAQMRHAILSRYLRDQDKKRTVRIADMRDKYSRAIAATLKHVTDAKNARLMGESEKAAGFARQAQVSHQRAKALGRELTLAAGRTPTGPLVAPPRVVFPQPKPKLAGDRRPYAARDGVNRHTQILKQDPYLLDSGAAFAGLGKVFQAHAPAPTPGVTLSYNQLLGREALPGEKPTGHQRDLEEIKKIKEDRIAQQTAALDETVKQSTAAAAPNILLVAALAAAGFLAWKYAK